MAVFLLAIFFFALFGVLAAPLTNPVIEIQCGKIEGTFETLYDKSNEFALFKSLPYGQQPERWAKPSPSPCWGEKVIYNATYFRGKCVQPDGSGDEDCLFVTAFIPLRNSSLPKPGSNLPVMVYIHGGGLMGGSGNDENPSAFVDRTNSIAFTINYRLNIHGFLITDSLSKEQDGFGGNYGILDQQLALKWVKENAYYFGGDKNRITIVGQSSGGTSIFALYSSPFSKGLFSSAVAWSGSPNLSLSLKKAKIQNQPVVDSLNCSFPHDFQEENKCLRSQSLSALAKAILPDWNTPGLFGIDKLTQSGIHTFAALPIVDGEVITRSFESAMKHAVIDVPLMMGAMGQEADTGPDNRIRGLSMLKWKSLLNYSLSTWDDQENAVEDIYSLYIADGTEDVQRAYDSFHSDYSLTCAFIKIASQAKESGHFKSPIYIYRNQWQPSVGLYHGGNPWVRKWAFHGWDLRAAFETWPQTSNPGDIFPSDPDFELSKYLQSTMQQLMFTGKLDPSKSAGWDSVEKVEGFPHHYGIQLISSPDLFPFQITRFEKDGKHEVCKTLKLYGFDEKMWWVN